MTGHGRGGKSHKPLRLHLAQMTPLTFVLYALTFALGAFVTFVIVASPVSSSWRVRLAVGIAGSLTSLGLAAYLLMGKGLAVGQTLVSRPTFVPASHAAASLRVRTRDAGVVGGTGGPGGALSAAAVAVTGSGGDHAGTSVGGGAVPGSSGGGRAKLA